MAFEIIPAWDLVQFPRSHVRSPGLAEALVNVSAARASLQRFQ